MIIPLRNRHYMVWIMLTILLPIGFFAAWRFVPNKIFDESELALLQPAVGELVQSYTTTNFVVNLRVGNVGAQVEVLIRQPLENPSTFVYLGDTVEEATTLGVLGAKGLYRFNLPRAPKEGKLIFFDRIKNETIESIVL